MALAAKGVPSRRVAREVEVIVAQWLHAPNVERFEVKSQLDELREQIAIGVGDAEEQLADVDTSEAAAMKQAEATLAALIATRDATQRALASL
jgi:hypothetical protein